MGKEALICSISPAMITENLLFDAIRRKKSYLCIGLDPDPSRMPAGITRDAEGTGHFCRQIIEATEPFAVACKINSAFFETLGSRGWDLMQELFGFCRERGLWTIADAKRGDIGNTSEAYARAFFDVLGADAITLSPYMGRDSVQPFLDRPGKTAILLALTSNPGHADFEMLELKDGRRVFEAVMEKSAGWERKGNLMFVVGATRAAEIEGIRKICPEHFLLIPGVGAQGGDLETISRLGLTRQGGLLVNASRSILYASAGEDYSLAAAGEARRMQEIMAVLLRDMGVLK